MTNDFCTGNVKYKPLKMPTMMNFGYKIVKYDKKGNVHLVVKLGNRGMLHGSGKKIASCPETQVVPPYTDCLKR